jgi:putative component of membrane protein insertase Oxa1/YidC/SpoIIIJ protein YidD
MLLFVNAVSLLACKYMIACAKYGIVEAKAHMMCTAAVLQFLFDMLYVSYYK